MKQTSNDRGWLDPPVHFTRSLVKVSHMLIGRTPVWLITKPFSMVANLSSKLMALTRASLRGIHHLKHSVRAENIWNARSSPGLRRKVCPLRNKFGGPAAGIGICWVSFLSRGFSRYCGITISNNIHLFVRSNTYYHSCATGICHDFGHDTNLSPGPAPPDAKGTPVAFRPRKAGLQIPPSDPGKRPGDC